MRGCTYLKPDEDEDEDYGSASSRMSTVRRHGYVNTQFGTSPRHKCDASPNCESDIVNSGIPAL